MCTMRPLTCLAVSRSPCSSSWISWVQAIKAAAAASGRQKLLCASLRYWRGVVEARALLLRVLWRAERAWEARADAAQRHEAAFQRLSHVGVCVGACCGRLPRLWGRFHAMLFAIGESKLMAC
jgi:hypothetical protein